MSEQVIYFTLEQFCHSVPMQQDQIIEIVHLGIVEPQGKVPNQWRFDVDMLASAKRAWRLHRQLELDWPGVAVALQLLQQVENLTQENQRLRSQLARFISLE